MTSPYRNADRALRTYDLCTRLPWLEAYGCVAAFLLFLYMFVSHSRLEVVAAFTVAGLVLPLLLVPRLDRYRVAGGRGQLRIYSDHVELPHAFRKEPVRLAVNELTVDVVAREVWINGISFGETHMLVLRTSDGRRTLSSSLFASEADIRDAYVSLLAARRGELHHADDETQGVRRDRYDDMLDRELERLDA